MTLFARLFGRKPAEPSTSPETRERLQVIAAPHQSALAEQADRRDWEREHGKKPSAKVEQLHPPRDRFSLAAGTRTDLKLELAPRRDDKLKGLIAGCAGIPDQPRPMTGFPAGYTPDELVQLFEPVPAIQPSPNSGICEWCENMVPLNDLTMIGAAFSICPDCLESANKPDMANPITKQSQQVTSFGQRLKAWRIGGNPRTVTAWQASGSVFYNFITGRCIRQVEMAAWSGIGVRRLRAIENGYEREPTEAERGKIEAVTGEL